MELTPLPPGIINFDSGLAVSGTPSRLIGIDVSVPLRLDPLGNAQMVQSMNASLSNAVVSVGLAPALTADLSVAWTENSFRASSAAVQVAPGIHGFELTDLIAITAGADFVLSATEYRGPVIVTGDGNIIPYLSGTQLHCTANVGARNVAPVLRKRAMDALSHFASVRFERVRPGEGRADRLLHAVRPRLCGTRLLNWSKQLSSR